MERSPMTEKILSLTLDIICILTGEDYTVVKKTSGECVCPVNCPHVSRGWSRTKSPIKESPSHFLIHERKKEQKILELTTKIIELLTGEVPMRCEYVTVYFSMEEWEYIEGHKDLYEDVILEKHQAFTSQGLPKDSTHQCTPVHMKEEPVLSDRENLTGSNIYTTDNIQQFSYSDIKEEMASCDRESMEDTNSFTPTDHTPLYSPTMKDESNSLQDKCNPGPIIYAQTNHTPQYLSVQIMEETTSSYQCNSTVTSVHRSSDHTQQYPSLDTKDELASQEKGQFTVPDMCMLTDQAMHPPTILKDGSISCDSGHSAASSIYTPSDCTHQYQFAHSISEPVACERKKLSARNLTDMDQLVSFSREKLYNKYGYIFREHTYTHLNRNKLNVGADSFLEDFMDSLPNVVGASTAVEELSTEEGLAELQYISNHVTSPDWCPAKTKRHNVFLSKCIEYEKHFCKVSHARICGTHLTQWSFNCSECQNCLKTTLKLIRQNLKHQEVKDKSVKKISSFGKQTKKKEFVCLDCGKHFPNKRYLLIHKKVHSEENPFHCPACGESFEDSEGFVAHQKNPACEKPFSCSECGKRFKSRYNSEYHKKIHTENKKYLCPVCGKSFRKQSCFMVHQRTHTGEKPYACPECGRCFSQNASLISHQRLHTGEKPFICLECGRNFTQRISLVVHQRVHSGDRPYKCQECGKGFTQRIGLVQHQRRHTGEKPFTCSECGKSFTLHDSLVKHLRTHTGEKPYICSECGKRFCQSSQLTAHKRFHHATHHNTGENV
ncbi:uncharacterized protein LOC142311212 isoform X1 [Anomaloglossus baeobatrachus]|uniref:uncharacterized protein LOC142311212 isoform X1 n=2 Tax=Anomaloglossus baeobatrachus TaxID=238106 RepID=UPI003F5027C7